MCVLVCGCTDVGYSILVATVKEVCILLFLFRFIIIEHKNGSVITGTVRAQPDV